ncbi:hypothetical protein ABIE89_000126 [Bradyrhizobium niftali]
MRATPDRPASRFKSLATFTQCIKGLESDVTLSRTVLRWAPVSVCCQNREGLRMSQLVGSSSPWSIMIIIPGGAAVGRVLQPVLFAALWLERSFERLAIPKARLRGCSGPGHQRADEVRVERRRPPSDPLSRGRCLPKLNKAPPLARHRAKISSPNWLSAQSLLSRGGKAWRSRKGATDGWPAQVFKEPELQLSLRVARAASENIAWHYGAES